MIQCHKSVRENFGEFITLADILRPVKSCEIRIPMPILLIFVKPCKLEKALVVGKKDI